MFDIFRDAPVGQLIRWISRNRYLQYPDERPGFQLPRTWNQKQISDLDLGLSFIEQSSEDLGGDIGLREFGSTSAILPDEGHQTGFRPSMQDAKHDDTIIVDWYSDHDSENPQNWTHRKKVGITLIICLYTFVVYTSSAIYTSSIQGVMNEFGVDTIKSTLGLSLYVLGYGIGPLIFSPLSEIPSIGRNPVYAVTMIIFVIISVPTAFATTFESLVILRFFQGFFGSPCLASGAASLSDMFDMATLPYAMLAWVSASYCGRKNLKSSTNFAILQLY
ncbi:hypothetical protein QQS21_002522 [Conoideocrella luteorostrata]|uniref:Major facilitator superfamily (MFS) profile domain-containing protein n=1 Tax=Conoideocrella luteorostrata TaxID=1105319 RepID=A0AAJ0G2W4_9HYPO|nr:hypothetical protein QQS21_002522 [Conoideocrella luteorostrata]